MANFPLYVRDITNKVTNETKRKIRFSLLKSGTCKEGRHLLYAKNASSPEGFRTRAKPADAERKLNTGVVGAGY